MLGLLSMQKINSSFLFKVLPRACLIFVICLSLIAFTSYTAPKACAEAFTFTLTSLFLSIVLSVIASLGVQLFASTIEEGISHIETPFTSFLQGKGFSSISDYLTSAGIYNAVQLATPVIGAIQISKVIYDIIAEFCNTFFSDNGIDDGASPIISPNILNVVPVGNGSSNAPSFTVTDSEWHIPGYSKIYMGGSSSLFGYKINNIPHLPNVVNFTISTQPYANYGVGFSSPSATSGISLQEGLFVYFIDSSGSHLGTAYSVGNYQSPATIVNATVPAGTTGIEILFQNARIVSYPYVTLFPFTVTFDEAVNPLLFEIRPSDTVSSPPSVAQGQVYSISSSSVTADTSTEDAIIATVMPITSTAGLTTTAVVSTPTVSDLESVKEDIEAIRNNTNPHFDFIPTSLGISFSIWHYVVEMMNFVNPAFSLLGSFITSMPSPVLIFPFGVFALAITVALFRRFLS